MGKESKLKRERREENRKPVVVIDDPLADARALYDQARANHEFCPCTETEGELWVAWQAWQTALMAQGETE